MEMVRAEFKEWQQFSDKLSSQVRILICVKPFSEKEHQKIEDSRSDTYKIKTKQHTQIKSGAEFPVFKQLLLG